MNPKFENLIIFELANNHQGSVEHGIEIIKKLGEAARAYRINAAVKLQYRDLDTMIHPDYMHREDVKHIPRFLSTRMTNDQFYTLIKTIKKEGLISMCTPFDEKSVDLIMDHGIEIIKVASCSAMDWPLLEKIAHTKRPVIISTGGKTFRDMDKIYNFLKHRDVDFAMLHCTGLYPVPNEDVQLNCIDRMKNRYYQVPIGYSGHEAPDDFSIVQMAVAKGAVLFERHVGLATDEIKLNAYSTNAPDVGLWIEAIQRAQVICGTSHHKHVGELEIQSMNELARGCYAAQPIKKGQKITQRDVFFAMPCQKGQTTSGQFKPGGTATRHYSQNEPIFEKEAVSVATDTRSILHDVKGMLYEAKIIPGEDVEVELSHHYGLEHFRHYGATILNLINREYCKKLIVVLPGQQHPMHKHKIKEESFHVLNGTLHITLNGIERDVEAGGIVTIERGTMHAFTSTDGCIVEEVSTTHVRNDSYYEDEKIAALDLMERKTLLNEW
ncbi:MAG: N-acetylneuraminate synthase family protein [Christensenellales bacterium]|jgi:sialic acid synthase SpsE/quercetin dioxygenase-like cupin family protein